MRGKILMALTLTCAVAVAQEGRSVVEAAIKNIGDVKSIQYSGSGAVFTLGQNVSPASPWPRVEVKSFTRTVDYVKLATRNEAVGAASPVATQFYAGEKAWNQTGNNVTPSAPAVAVERQLQIWLTPHGFLKGALANNAKVKRGKVSYTALGKYQIIGTLSKDHLVEKVETWLDNPVLGDMHVETIYSNYRDFGGFRFPTRIVQQQGGFPVWDLTVTGAKPNVSVNISIPDSVRKAAPPAVQVTSQKLSDGVWYLTGGTHHSVAVEFADHVAVIEAPQTEERSTAVIAEVKKLVAAKPIRYLINTHHHFDHSGGVRAYVAEGATIVTHQSNKPFYQKTLKDRRKLNPDRQTRERKKVRILAIGAKHVLSDSTRTIEIHHIQGNPHNTGIVMAYLPKEKLLVEVDVYTPLAPDARPPSTPNPATVNLYENIERLNLDVKQIVPLHGRVVALAELRKTIGK